jgi:uncharacterized alpha-E superfamily protein
MLSRTADSLFWLGRYTERAANVARGLTVAGRMAGLGTSGEWRSLLIATGCDVGFFGKHATAVQEFAADYLVRDRDNPSSILSCFAAARANARMVRTALTVDMWGGLNDSWQQIRDVAEADFQGEKLPGFLDWVRERVLLFNGAAQDTMLRGEAFHFVQLGTALERADNTARLLDVKHELLEGGDTGTGEYAQWQAILQSVSALRAYHWVYRQGLEADRIAELLILRPEMPRSLAACHGRVAEVLDAIAEGQGGRRGECHRRAHELRAMLRDSRVERLLEEGLHDFLTRMIVHTAELGGAIERFYIQGDEAAP